MNDGTQEPISWQQFNKWEPPYQEFLLAPGILKVRGTGILFGKEGSFKTMLGLRLATSVVEGKPWLKFNTPEHGANVLYINAEVPAEMLLDRTKAMNKGMELQGELFIWNRLDFRLDEDKWIERLEHYIEKYNIKLVVIDPLYQVITGILSDPLVVVKVQNTIDRLRSKHAVAFFLVSHARKGNKDDPSMGEDSIYGSAYWGWWVDLKLRIERGEEEEDIKVMFDKTRHSKKGRPAPLKLRLVAEDLDFVEQLAIIKGV